MVNGAIHGCAQNVENNMIQVKCERCEEHKAVIRVGHSAKGFHICHECHKEWKALVLKHLDDNVGRPRALERVAPMSEAVGTLNEHSGRIRS